MANLGVLVIAVLMLVVQIILASKLFHAHYYEMIVKKYCRCKDCLSGSGDYMNEGASA